MSVSDSVGSAPLVVAARDAGGPLRGVASALRECNTTSMTSRRTLARGRSPPLPDRTGRCVGGARTRGGGVRVVADGGESRVRAARRPRVTASDGLHGSSRDDEEGHVGSSASPPNLAIRRLLDAAESSGSIVVRGRPDSTGVVALLVVPGHATPHAEQVVGVRVQLLVVLRARARAPVGKLTGRFDRGVPRRRGFQYRYTMRREDAHAASASCELRPVGGAEA